MPRGRREAAGATRPSRSRTPVLPELIDLPTGNVHIIPAQRRSGNDAGGPARVEDSAAEAVPGWVIYDGDGTALEPALDSRPSALRQMGVLAYHGARLPLTLHGPDGQPTGDRLP